MNKNIKIIALLLLTLTYSSCNVFFDNPVDPESEDYQGYETVVSLSDVKSYSTKGSYDEPPTLIVSELVGANKYKWQISQSLESLSNSEYYITEENVFNNKDLNLTYGIWYWRAKAVDSNGNYGDWTQVRNFTMNSYKITYYERNSSIGLNYNEYSEKYSIGDLAIVRDNNKDLGPAMLGYEFSFTFWDTEPDGSGKSYYPGDKIIIDNQDIELYAQYYSYEIDLNNWGK